MSFNPKIINKYIILCIVLFIFWYFVLKTSHSNKDTHVISDGGVPSEELTHSVWSFDLADLYDSSIIGFNIVSSVEGTLFLIPTNDATFYDSEGTFSSKTDEEIKNIKAVNGNRIYSLEFILKRYENRFTYVVTIENEELDLIKTLDIFSRNNLVNNLIIRTKNTNILSKIKSSKIKSMVDTKNFNELMVNINNEYIDIINIDKKLMTKDNVNLIRSNNKTVSVQNLQNIHEIKDAIKMNVDLYSTYHTAKAIALEKKYRRNLK